VQVSREVREDRGEDSFGCVGCRAEKTTEK
jgi:hypothetical protein